MPFDALFSTRADRLDHAPSVHWAVHLLGWMAAVLFFGWTFASIANRPALSDALFCAFALAFVGCMGLRELRIYAPSRALES